MNCQQAANLISAGIDGELADGDAFSLDAHLAECQDIQSQLAEPPVARRIKSVSRSMAVSVPPALPYSC